MFGEAESRLGRLDGVVINAGIVAPSLPLADMDSARLKRMFEVNVYGAYLCAPGKRSPLVEGSGRRRRRDRPDFIGGEAAWVHPSNMSTTRGRRPPSIP